MEKWIGKSFEAIRMSNMKNPLIFPPIKFYGRNDFELSAEDFINHVGEINQQLCAIEWGYTELENI